MRIKKVKVTKYNQIHMIYTQGKYNQDEYSFTCSEKARPEFYEAMSALAEYVIDMCELPEDYLKSKGIERKAACLKGRWRKVDEVREEVRWFAVEKSVINANEIEQEIELAKMMAADIDKVFKKYAKAALAAEQARAEKFRNKKYKGCEDIQELQDLYGWGEFTEKEYQEGIEFFECWEEGKKQLSLIELHRKNLREIRDRWKGTVRELQEELDELNGVVKDTRNAFEKREAEERAERYAAMR